MHTVDHEIAVVEHLSALIRDALTKKGLEASYPNSDADESDRRRAYFEKRANALTRTRQELELLFTEGV